jgi:hypothetical protein
MEVLLMKMLQAAVAFLLVLNSVPSFSSDNVCRPIVQNCNSVKANDKNYKTNTNYKLCRESYVRCLAGEKEAARYAEEQKKHERRAKIRDAICVADAIGGDAAAYAAGWQGKVVYKGTRAAADAISNGASSCPVKRK